MIKSLALILFVASAIFIADQALKTIFVEGFRFYTPCIDLILVYNKGVAFSMFAFLEEGLKWIQLALLAGVVGYTLWLKQKCYLLPVGIMVGAGFSNVADRFIHGGVVLCHVNIIPLNPTQQRPSRGRANRGSHRRDARPNSTGSRRIPLLKGRLVRPRKARGSRRFRGMPVRRRRFRPQRILCRPHRHGTPSRCPRRSRCRAKSAQRKRPPRPRSSCWTTRARRRALLCPGRRAETVARG